MIENRWNLHRYAAMHRHWAEFGPPAYIAVAAYFGLSGPKAIRGGRLCTAEELADFLATMPGGARA